MQTRPRHGVQAVFHNTLAASEYGLIDQATLAPRPNYWAALLWRRFMGSTMLDAGHSRPGLHLYAHSLRDHPGGVALLAINSGREQTAVIDLPMPSDRYTLTARQLQATQVQLNGQPLAFAPNHRIPPLQGDHIPSGELRLAPARITFLAIPDTANSACYSAASRLEMPSPLKRTRQASHARPR